MKCRRCHRPLKEPTPSGYGPECILIIARQSALADARAQDQSARWQSLTIIKEDHGLVSYISERDMCELALTLGYTDTPAALLNLFNQFCDQYGAFDFTKSGIRFRRMAAAVRDELTLLHTPAETWEMAAAARY